MQRVTRSIAFEDMKLRNDVCPTIFDKGRKFYKLKRIPMSADNPRSHKGDSIYFVSGDIYSDVQLAGRDSTQRTWDE